MVDRLSVLDTPLLYADAPITLMHVGAVSLAALIEEPLEELVSTVRGQ